jgi:hypothetical protein
MRSIPSNLQRRRGAMAPVAALLLVVLLAMVAFAVDIGWMTTAQAELQTAADAAALAGAQPLVAAYVQYHLPGQKDPSAILNTALADARTRAKECASYNAAGEVKSLTLLDSDIEFGFTDSNKNYTPMPTYTGFPNTIKVRLRRDGQANNPLQLYFAQVLGAARTDLSATASAALYGGVIDSFNVGNNKSIALLPMTYDADHWDQFLATGLDPDGEHSLAYDGTTQLRVYSSTNDKGNFGELALDDEHAGTAEIRTWIRSGLSPCGVKTLTDRKLLPLSAHDPSKWDWLGNPGFRASTVMDVNARAGKTFFLPLFKAKNSSAKGYQAGVGAGSHYNYNIVRFVPIKIMPPFDWNKEIVVQPAAVSDSNLILSNVGIVNPSSSSSALTITLTGPRLIQ